MACYINLMTTEVIPGARPMTLDEIYKCDILYYLDLVKYSRNNIKTSTQEAFVDAVGI